MLWKDKPKFHLIDCLFLCTCFIFYSGLVYAQANSETPTPNKNSYFTEQNILDYLKKDNPKKYTDLVTLRKKSLNQYVLQLLSFYEELNAKENLKNNNPELYKILQGDLSPAQEIAILNYIKTNIPETYNSIIQLKTQNIGVYKDYLSSYKKQIYASENLRNTYPELYKSIQDIQQTQIQDPALICQNLSKSKITKKEAEKQLSDTILLLYKKTSNSQQVSLIDLKQKLNNVRELAKYSNLPKEVITSYTNEAEAALKSLELKASRFKQDTTGSLNKEVGNILKHCEQTRRGEQ